MGIFSIALEVAQLGALAPAAVFDHNPCLTYKAPFGTPVGAIRDLIVPWGYCIWSLVVACLPLAVCGLVILGIPFIIGKVIQGCGMCCARTCKARSEPGQLTPCVAKMNACTSTAEDVLT